MFNGLQSEKGTSTSHFCTSTLIYRCDAEVRIEQCYDKGKRLRGCPKPYQPGLCFSSLVSSVEMSEGKTGRLIKPRLGVARYGAQHRVDFVDCGVPTFK